MLGKVDPGSKATFKLHPEVFRNRQRAVKELGFCPESSQCTSMTMTEEREAAAVRHKLCSNSAELRFLQELKANVAGFSLSSDVKDISSELTLNPVSAFVPLRRDFHGDASILLFIWC